MGGHSVFSELHVFMWWVEQILRIPSAGVLSGISRLFEMMSKISDKRSSDLAFYCLS